jgi:pimeloyl-ACP methyl ester carboxylesterase
MLQGAKVFAIATTLMLLLVFAGSNPPAQAAGTGVKNIVLVHGAWADGSSWAKVIPLLQAKGYTVTAVQNPLTSLDDDVSATKRVLDMQNGPVLLVGHSWAGMVITQAGTDPKVAGLVYVDAFAPDVGQSTADLGKGYPAPAGLSTVLPAGAFLWLSPAGVAQFFAPDLPRSETDVMAATQGPIAASSFGAKVTAAAWKTKPSWAIYGSRDQMIDTGLERDMAKRINAAVLVVDGASHVPMLSQLEKVANFIAAAAASL